MLAVNKIKKALKIDYNLPPKTLDRYAEMLMQRAVRFYIQNELDLMTVTEDLYPFCSKCDEEQEFGKRKSSCCKAPIYFPNLEHSELHEKTYKVI